MISLGGYPGQMLQIENDTLNGCMTHTSAGSMMVIIDFSQVFIQNLWISNNILAEKSAGIRIITSTEHVEISNIISLSNWLNKETSLFDFKSFHSYLTIQNSSF